MKTTLKKSCWDNNLTCNRPVQEGREVREVNVGFEYVSLTGNQRWQFLRSLLERRFAYLESPIDILDVLPLSNIKPAIGMAKAIRNAVEIKGRFYITVWIR